jgi:hypothetical protein
LYFNSNIIQSTHFKISLPHPSNSSVDEDVASNKLTVYENFVSQLLSLLKSENIRKYCKKEAEAGDKVILTYQKLLQSAKESLYCSQLKYLFPYAESKKYLRKEFLKSGSTNMLRT